MRYIFMKFSAIIRQVMISQFQLKKLSTILQRRTHSTVKRLGYLAAFVYLLLTMVFTDEDKPVIKFLK